MALAAVPIFLAETAVLGAIAARREGSLVRDKFEQAPVSALLIVAGVAAAVAMHRTTYLLGRETIVLACTVVCGVSDVRTGLIFDRVTLPTVAALLVCAVATATLPAALLGALSCAVPLLLLHAVTRGRGLGLGDVKLAAVLGAGLGSIEGLKAIGIAFVAGALVGVAGLLSRRISRKQAIKFAPYLALGSCIVVAGAAT